VPRVGAIYYGRARPSAIRIVRKMQSSAHYIGSYDEALRCAGEGDVRAAMWQACGGVNQ